MVDNHLVCQSLDRIIEMKEKLSKGVHRQDEPSQRLSIHFLADSATSSIGLSSTKSDTEFSFLGLRKLLLL